MISLTDVQVDARDCRDAVVFQFSEPGAVPGYTVSYEPGSSAKTEAGSGRQIDIAGSAFLVVRLSPAATARIEGENVVPTYKGPRRLKADGTRSVREVVKTGDFEAVVTWVIGIDGERPFTAGGAGRFVVIEVG
jgi:hypothetical protein